MSFTYKNWVTPQVLLLLRCFYSSGASTPQVLLLGLVDFIPQYLTRAMCFGTLEAAGLQL